MEFEWDEDKRRQNLGKHGIDFERAKEIWQGVVLEGPSPQTRHGEERFMAIGQSERRVMTVVFTWRGNVRRIISARTARQNERKDYQKKIG